MSKSFEKFVALVEDHQNCPTFSAINIKKSKINMTADVLALITKYKMRVKGNFVYFREVIK